MALGFRKAPCFEKVGHHECVSEVFSGGSQTRSAHGARAPKECESQWATVVSIAGKIGSTQTLLNWVCQHARDMGQREGVTTAEAKRVKELEGEVRELRRVNQIPRLAIERPLQREGVTWRAVMSSA